MVVFFEVSGEPVLCLPSYKYVDRNQGISIAGFVVVSHRVALEVGMLSDEENSCHCFLFRTLARFSSISDFLDKRL